MSIEKHIAIVLSAGKGTRMKSNIQKQYLLLREKPIIYYSLAELQKCPFIDEIILVTGQEEIEYNRLEIVERYGFTKVTNIVAGGKERYHSVYAGLKSISTCDYVYIHDGARPFIDQEILSRIYEAVRADQACAVGMPVKDTIKISNHEGYAEHTPPRDLVWMIQTPQAFQYDLIKRAYDKLIQKKVKGVTDDAMVIEYMEKKKVKLVPGSYSNIKITTPEDLEIAELFCRNL